MAPLKLALVMCLIVEAACVKRKNQEEPTSADPENNHWQITNWARGAYHFVKGHIPEIHATHIVAASTVVYIANNDVEVRDSIIAAATNNDPHTKDFRKLKDALLSADIGASAAILQKVLELHIKQPRNMFGGAIKSTVPAVAADAGETEAGGKRRKVVDAVKEAVNSDAVKDTAQRAGMAAAFAYTQGAEPREMAEAVATAATGMTKEQVADVSDMMKAAVSGDAHKAADSVLHLFKVKLATIPEIAEKLVASGMDQNKTKVEAAGHLFKAFNTRNKVELGKATDLLLGTNYIEGAVYHLQKFIDKETLQSLFPAVSSLWPFRHRSVDAQPMTIDEQKQ